MISFGWSDYDPVNGSATSIDPLRSLAYSTMLGDIVFPGTSGRVWRIRYLSALCFLMKCAKLERGQPFSENYKKFRRLENAFILSLNELKKRNNTNYDFQRIIGLEKAEQLARSNSRGISIGSDILANQVNLGPLGVHTVLLRELKLIESDRELMLLADGEILANQFEEAIGKNKDFFLERVANNRVQAIKPEDFSHISESILFEFDKKISARELKLINEKLFDDPTRKQLFTDMLSVKDKIKGEVDEAILIQTMQKVKSPLSESYKLIAAYDNFQRVLSFYFNTIRDVPKERIQYPLKNATHLKNVFNEIKKSLVESANLLDGSINDFMASQKTENETTLIEIQRYANDVVSFNDFVEFTEFLVGYHEKHQKEKNKEPWIKKSASNDINVNPNYSSLKEPMGSLQEFMRKRVHNYRFSNCLTMINDMKLEKVS